MTRLGRLRQAFLFGVKDGRESGEGLRYGITWEDDEQLCEAYDRGVNVGQRR